MKEREITPYEELIIELYEAIEVFDTLGLSEESEEFIIRQFNYFLNLHRIKKLNNKK